jgi:multidrug transporter EmrE-like cation transporter
MRLTPSTETTPVTSGSRRTASSIWACNRCIWANDTSVPASETAEIRPRRHDPKGPGEIALECLASQKLGALDRTGRFTGVRGGAGVRAGKLERRIGEGRREDVDSQVWLLLGYLIVLGTIVPFLLMVTALHSIPATRVTVIAMLEPALAAVVAYAWLGEELMATQIVGCLLVLAAVAIAQTARATDYARS